MLLPAFGQVRAFSVKIIGTERGGTGMLIQEGEIPLVQIDQQDDKQEEKDEEKEQAIAFPACVIYFRHG